MKTCTRCKAEKSLEMFSGHPAASDGKQSQCKACFAERARERRVGRPCQECGRAMPENARVRSKSCDACLTTCRTCGSAQRSGTSRNCAPCQAAIDRERKSSDGAKFKERTTRIASKYGVRKALAVVLAASSRCEACGKACERVGEAHVDHCHSTGLVRGILCFNCNAALGHLQDSEDRILALLRYLRRTETTKEASDLEKARHFIDLLIQMETQGGEVGRG